MYKPLNPVVVREAAMPAIMHCLALAWKFNDIQLQLQMEDELLRRQYYICDVAQA